MLREHFAPTGLWHRGPAVTINIALRTELFCPALKKVGPQSNCTGVEVRFPRYEITRVEPLSSSGWHPCLPYRASILPPGTTLSEPVLKFGLPAILVLVLVRHPRSSGLFSRTRTRDENENEDPPQFQKMLSGQNLLLVACLFPPGWKPRLYGRQGCPPLRGS